MTAVTCLPNRLKRRTSQCRLAIMASCMRGWVVAGNSINTLHVSAAGHDREQIPNGVETGPWISYKLSDGEKHNIAVCTPMTPYRAACSTQCSSEIFCRRNRVIAAKSDHALSEIPKSF